MWKSWPLHAQVVAVTAVRTGAGKSQVSAYVNQVLHDHKLKTVLVRHPMPYGEAPQHPVWNQCKVLRGQWWLFVRVWGAAVELSVAESSAFYMFSTSPADSASMMIPCGSLQMSSRYHPQRSRVELALSCACELCSQLGRRDAFASQGSESNERYTVAA